MSIYRELTVAGTPTRSAAELTGISRATATRKARARFPVMEPVAQPVPANKIDPTERAGVLAVLNSDRFVDQAPLQVYAQLLDEGTYLCSVPTMYRVLVEARGVKERRRLARHPAGAAPGAAPCGCSRTRPHRSVPGVQRNITKLAGPIKGLHYDAHVMIDICSRYIVGAHVVRALLLFLLAGLSAWWAFVAAYPRPATSYQGPGPPAAGTALLQPRLSFGLASGAGERLERPRMQWLNLGCGVAGDHCPATLPGGPRCPAVANDDLGGEVPWLMVAMRVRPQ